MSTPPDSTWALQDQIDRSGAGSLIELGKGPHFLTRKVQIKNHRVNLVGAGPHATTIFFDPPKDDTCFEVSAGPNVIFQGSIQGMSFCTNDSKYTKVAIDLVDSSEYTLDRIATYNWFGGKAGSVALRTRGRVHAAPGLAELV